MLEFEKGSPISRHSYGGLPWYLGQHNSYKRVLPWLLGHAKQLQKSFTLAPCFSDLSSLLSDFHLDKSDGDKADAAADGSIDADDINLFDFSGNLTDLDLGSFFDTNDTNEGIEKILKDFENEFGKVKKKSKEAVCFLRHWQPK